MICTRLDDTTTKKMQESMDIGNYYLMVPGNGPQPFFIEDPHIRIQKWGGCSHTNMIDIDTSLRGGKIPLSSPKYYPSTKLLYTENSRLTHPAWDLKGIEVHKGDYLHYDPRIKSNIPFAHNICSRERRWHP